MKPRIEINSEKCSGCRICSLACSFTYFKVFNPERAYISVTENEETGSFDIELLDGCLACRVCEEHCPFGVIKRVAEAETAQGEKQ